MKRILVLIFATLMLFSLFACQRKSDLEKFLDKNKDTMVGELSALFGEGAGVSAKVEDNAFVFEVTAPEFDYLIDAQKSVLKERLKEIIPTGDMIKHSNENNEKLRDLENYIVIVKDSKGEVIVEVKSIEGAPTTEAEAQEVPATT
ncbi:MAG: hypothetical protein IKB72_03460 [Ruminococcus sp.]|nr:hypothetical protein [Oscillospiraceae bacterium]MBR2724475.1 hypothetical protein [Ruminococcus sp.]